MSNHGHLEPEPSPQPNGKPSVWEAVIEDTKRFYSMFSCLGNYDRRIDGLLSDMKLRDKQGREKYGTPLQPFNGRNALRDAYQEALDLCVYLKQKIIEGPHSPEIENIYFASIRLSLILRMEIEP